MSVYEGWLQALSFTPWDQTVKSKVKITLECSCSQQSRICLLLQQGLDGTDSEMPLLPSSGHSPASYPVTTLRTTTETSPHTIVFSTWTPYYQQPWAPRFVRTVPPTWRLRSTPWPTCFWPHSPTTSIPHPPLPGLLSHTRLSLGLYPTPASPWASIFTMMMWHWRAWTTSSLSWLIRNVRALSFS